MTILTEVNKVNNAQKTVLVGKILDHYKGNIKGKHFAAWGLAFKPNTDDMREAPSVIIINELLKNGATVSAYDPAAIDTSKVYLKDTITYASGEYETLDKADALLVFTEWNEFRNPDFEVLKEKLSEPVIFDGRNIFTPEKMKDLGFTYYSIGRQDIK
jgi:UDPglucose 6-dehydrogenase